jgi:hypothetical protein
MALFVEVVPGDRIHIGSSVLTVEDKPGRKTRIRIDALKSVDVFHEKADEQKAKPVLTRPKLPPR